MICLIIGGTASGKSSFAESLAMKLEPEKKAYIATMLPFDQECRTKIEKHQAMRAKKNFLTWESPMNIHTVSPTGTKTALLECMSNLLANEMFINGNAYDHVTGHIIEGVDQLYKQLDHLIIVTNDIFHFDGDYTPETRQYIQYFSQLNLELATMADVVVEVVCGIPLYHKGEMRI